MTSALPTVRRRARQRFPLALLLSLALGACSGGPSNPVVPGVLNLVGDISIECPGASLARITPANLWLPVDSQRVDTLSIAMSIPPGRACRSGVKTPSDGITSVQLSPLANARDTVRVAVRSSTTGWEVIWASVNAVKVAGVPLYVTPRRFNELAVGHRGAGAAWPENTLSAFRLAAAVHLPASEMDVRVSRDSVMVIMHDQTVDRTTNGTGYVKDLTLAQLKQLDDGAKFDAAWAGEPVPTLDEVLTATDTSGHHLILDIKQDQGVLTDSLEAVRMVALLKKHSAESRVMLLSTSTTFMRVARAQSPTVGIVLFAWGYKPSQRAFLRSIHGNGIMNAADSLLAPAMKPVFDSLAADGIAVLSSTANDANTIARLVNETPVKWILSDIPPRALMRSRVRVKFPY